jgi:hypothetical protein
MSFSGAGGNRQRQVIAYVGPWSLGPSAAVAAHGTYTITGVPATGSNNVYTINGHVATAPQTTLNSVTVQAAADVVVINAVPAIAAIATATSSLGVITITANVAGAAGNAITTVGASTGGDVVTADQAVLAGGADAFAGDDFGPYRFPSGWTKAQFQTEGTGSGWGITIYDGISQTIDDFVIGTYNPTYGIYANPHPPPPVPTAAYGALALVAGVNELVWNKSIGPAAQTGTGLEANPLVSNGTQGQTFIMNYPSIWARAKVTTAGTGTLKIWMFSAP